jgi:cellulose synthase/poly-beta-1,6-N-acetylglucosamine synthase-like glycosyltransferase
VDTIAATIERAISEPGLRARLAARARAATEPYDIARIEAREAALYRWLVAPRQPLVSVVLPTFNRARLIAGAVRNVLAQSYANLELIVVNDGSRDETREVLERLQRELGDSRLRVIHKENAGLPRALNTGFEAARGEYFTWTSDDNAFRLGALAAMARELELDRECIMVFADYQVISEDGKPGAQVSTGPVEDLARKNVVGACFMYRRDAAHKAGLYDANVELAEDYDYWLRLSRLGKLSHLPRVLYDYGDTPDSLTRLRELEVKQAAGRVLARQPQDPGARQALREHLAVLAGEFKERGLPLRSFSTALSLIARFPLSGSGYWAAARALTPRKLLRATRKLRGLHGE